MNGDSVRTAGAFLLTTGALALTLNPALALDLTSMAYDLGDNYSLRIDYDSAVREVTVALSQGAVRSLAITVGNANVAVDGIFDGRLCEGCERILFVPAYDLSSTYGAISGIIAWSNGSWWTMSLLPLSSPFVEDTNNDGIAELFDGWTSDGIFQTQAYQFSRGQLTAVGDVQIQQ